MSIKLDSKYKQILEDALTSSGLRTTRQREHILAVLLAQRDHPTADEVYARAKRDLPNISLATVYNCLDTLVNCNLVKRLNYERGPSRFCPNDGDHAHFIDERTGRVYDISIPESLHESLKQILPAGFEAKKIRLSFLGSAPNTDPQLVHSAHAQRFDNF